MNFLVHRFCVIQRKSHASNQDLSSLITHSKLCDDKKNHHTARSIKATVTARKYSRNERADISQRIIVHKSRGLIEGPAYTRSKYRPQSGFTSLERWGREKVRERTYSRKHTSYIELWELSRTVTSCLISYRPLDPSVNPSSSPAGAAEEIAIIYTPTVLSLSLSELIYFFPHVSRSSYIYIHTF